jgi:hypothetical protein
MCVRVETTVLHERIHFFDMSLTALKETKAPCWCRHRCHTFRKLLLFLTRGGDRDAAVRDYPFQAGVDCSPLRIVVAMSLLSWIILALCVDFEGQWDTDYELHHATVNL